MEELKINYVEDNYILNIKIVVNRSIDVHSNAQQAGTEQLF